MKHRKQNAARRSPKMPSRKAAAPTVTTLVVRVCCPRCGAKRDISGYLGRSKACLACGVEMPVVLPRPRV